MLPDFKLYYKDIIIETAWYWHKNRHIEKWTRIAREVNSHVYSQLIYNKGGKNIQWKNNTFFNK